MQGTSNSKQQYLYFVLTYIYHYFTLFLKILLLFLYIISMLIFNINIPFTNTMRTVTYFIYILLTTEYILTQT